MEQELGAVLTYIVPDYQAKTERETVEKTRLKPLVDPQQVRDFVVLEVLVKIRQRFLEQAVKYCQLLQKQFEPARIKSI